MNRQCPLTAPGVILKVSLSKQTQLLLEWINVSLSVCDASPDVFVFVQV